MPLPFQTALPASELDGLPIGAIPAAGDAATRYRWLDRRREIGGLAVLSLAVAGCLSVSLGPPPKLGNVKGPLDVELYYAVTQRVQAGQAYCDALGGELQARGYPTRSVFNWRTPLHTELIAHLPSLAWARVLLLLAAACAIGLSAAAMCRDRRNDDGRGWSGAWIAISVGCYALGWRCADASAGLPALFFRELAVPYRSYGRWRNARQNPHGVEDRVWRDGSSSAGCAFSSLPAEQAFRWAFLFGWPRYICPSPSSGWRVGAARLGSV